MAGINRELSQSRDPDLEATTGGAEIIIVDQDRDLEVAQIGATDTEGDPVKSKYLILHNLKFRDLMIDEKLDDFKISYFTKFNPFRYLLTYFTYIFYDFHQIYEI